MTRGQQWLLAQLLCYYLSADESEGRELGVLGVLKGRRAEKSSNKKHNVAGGSVAFALTEEEEMCER